MLQGRKIVILVALLSGYLYTLLSSQWVLRSLAVSRLFKPSEYDNDFYPEEQNGTLPSCRRLMREGGPLATGDFLTSHPFHWTPRPDGSRQYDLTETCTLHRYSARDARKCLSDKHIMFIGDSLTRYQVLSLVYLLERGVYPPRFNRPSGSEQCPYGSTNETNSCSPADKPNVCVVNDFRGLPLPDSWSSFHHEIGGGVDGGVFRGRMECDCVRGGVQCPADSPGCDVENFFYTTREEGTAGSGRRTNVSFFFEDGWGDDPRPIRGFNFTDCAPSGSCLHNNAVVQTKKQRASQLSYNWEQPLGDALERNGSLRELVPPVDVSIYNRGLWGQLTTAQTQRYMPLFRDLTAARSGRCFFKSTTGSERMSEKSLAHEQGFVKNETTKAGCSFLDVAQITNDFGKLTSKEDAPNYRPERSTIFFDTVHFRPWVYEELNNILLNVLCNSD